MCLPLFCLSHRMVLFVVAFFLMILTKQFMSSNRLLIISVTFFLSNVSFVHGKGGGIAGAAAGGGASAGADWTLGGNYTSEEMAVALVVLAIIMTISFIICSCQCYQKVTWELEGDMWFLNKGKRPMPPAPYYRESGAP